MQVPLQDLVENVSLNINLGQLALPDTASFSSTLPAAGDEEKKGRKIEVAFWPFKKLVNAPAVQNGGPNAERSQITVAKAGGRRSS